MTIPNDNESSDESSFEPFDLSVFAKTPSAESKPTSEHVPDQLTTAPSSSDLADEDSEPDGLHDAIDPEEIEDESEPVLKATDLSGATHGRYLIGSKGNRPASLYKKAGDEYQQICGPVWAAGEARDSNKDDWHTVVDFIDKDLELKRWLMPAALLAGDAREIVKVLLTKGLFIVAGKNSADDLVWYLRNARQKRYLTVPTTGWHEDDDGNWQFVMHPGMDPQALHNLLLQDTSVTKPATGTPGQWRDNVAAKCEGNSRLILGLSVAFASALLKLTDAESGGLHLVGKSSSGKSTVASVAASVWNQGIQSWDITPTKLEITAMRHNDIGLVLDEIGQADAFKIGSMVYTLANGRGKGRSNARQEDCETRSWRTMFLSTGEISLAELIASASIKNRATAGQEVRLIDVPIDAGEGMGAFEQLHGSESAGVFADQLNALSLKHSGHAGPALAKYLRKNRPECVATSKQIQDQFISAVSVETDDSQVRRVAKHFAVLAAAGEIATTAGITGWAEDAAYNAIVSAYACWREKWAVSGSREGETITELVRDFIQRHDGRFEDKHDTRKFMPNDRAGFRSDKEYWMYPTVFEELCTNAKLNRLQAARELIAAGHLVSGDEGGKARHTVARRADSKQQRFFVFNDSILGEESPDYADQRNTASNVVAWGA